MTRVAEIPGFPGYWIGDDGTVWSSRYGKRGASERRPLKTWRRPEGQHYTTVNLRAERNGRNLSQYVHRLVLAAFVGPCPPGAEACHCNGNTSDNRLANLRWDTRDANLAERRLLRGESHHSSKLTAAQVREIRTLAVEGMLQREIAARFGTTRGNVSAILRGVNWKDPGNKGDQVKQIGNAVPVGTAKALALAALGVA